MQRRISQFDPRAEALLRAYLADVDAGNAPDYDALCSAHADLAHELRELKAALDLADRFPRGTPRQRPIAERLKEEYGDKVELDVSLAAAPKVDAEPQRGLLGRLRSEGPRGTRYRLLGEVARGGMGAVVKICDAELRRTLAMKIVLGKDERASGETNSLDPKTVGRFLEEAQITGQLDHPGIVPVHELTPGRSRA